jgi:FixJ family two-component response regulator
MKPATILTLREAQFYRNCVTFDDKEIAGLMNISDRAVRKLASGVMRKFGVRRRRELCYILGMATARQGSAYGTYSNHADGC